MATAKKTAGGKTTKKATATGTEKPKKATRTAAEKPAKKAPAKKAPAKKTTRAATPKAAAPKAPRLKKIKESVVESERAAPAPAPVALEEARIAALTGLDRKAENVVVLDVRALTSYADYLVLMSASSDRQVGAVADAIDDALRKAGHRPLGVEGASTGNWVLIDTGDIVVHVFQDAAREFYDLDRLWADAPRITVEEPKPAPART